MERRTLSSRVETLERAVDELRNERAVIDAINTRTQALEVQFAHFRGEVRMQFSAMHERFAKMDDRFARIDERFDKVDEAIRQGDEETRRFMRVLHEELVGRIAVLGERS